MNYRHAYHAGNHADVFKHLVLARIFALLGRKDTPYAYLDSHSGVGLYDLQGDEASRTGEWQQGIARLWEREGLPEQLDDYLDVVRHLNPDGSLRYYPGSPELARRLTRAQDRVLLNELHPEDGRLLKANMAGERRVAVHQGDGWLLPRAFLPAPEKRAVLLIDPPFEQADELQRCVAALDEAIGRMRQTVVVIWYPIKDERQAQAFLPGPGTQRSAEAAACRAARASDRRRRALQWLRAGHRQSAVAAGGRTARPAALAGRGHGAEPGWLASRLAGGRIAVRPAGTPRCRPGRSSRWGSSPGTAGGRPRRNRTAARRRSRW